MPQTFVATVAGKLMTALRLIQDIYHIYEHLTFSLVSVLRSIGQNAGGFLERKRDELLRISAFTF